MSLGNSISLFCSHLAVFPSNSLYLYLFLHRGHHLDAATYLRLASKYGLGHPTIAPTWDGSIRYHFLQGWKTLSIMNLN